MWMWAISSDSGPGVWGYGYGIWGMASFYGLDNDIQLTNGRNNLVIWKKG